MTCPGGRPALNSSQGGPGGRGGGLALNSSQGGPGGRGGWKTDWKWLPD